MIYALAFLWSLVLLYFSNTLLYFLNYTKYLLISLHAISLDLKSLVEFLGFVYLFQLILNHSSILFVLFFGGVILDDKLVSLAFYVGTLTPKIKETIFYF